MNVNTIGLDEAMKLKRENMRHDIREWILEGIHTRQAMYHSVAYANQIRISAEMLTACITNGRKILVCGNGGSAGDSGHFVGELLNRFTKLREYPLPAIDLSAPNSTITAIANDYSFSEVFSKQVHALGQEGDVLVAISTSGKSENILKAIDMALQKHMKVIALTGTNGLPAYETYVMAEQDHRIQNIQVPSDQTPLIQEMHIMVIHILCYLLDKELEGGHD